MSKSINLIQKQPEKNDREELVKKVRKISVALLVSVALSSLLIFLLNYRFSIGYVRTQEEKLLKKMSSYEDLSSKVFLLNSRLSDISHLLSSRKIYNKTSELIIEKKPESLIFVDYQIDGSGIKISAISNKLSDINNYLNYLLSLSRSKKVASVVINSLSANSSGYSIDILVN